MSQLLNNNWKALTKPKQVICHGDDEDSKLSTIIMDPLDRGFGLTLGNALRRVLLSSLQGAAITSIKIPGVLHEFAAKSGIKEDVIDIILNLKGVVVRMRSAEKKILKIKAKGPCVVTASMIDTPSDVDILNPDHEICTVSKDTEFEMELVCETGRGYVPAASVKDKDLPIGVIPIDALFTPVKKVSYKVEDTRVGQVMDYDKLTMEIETNGSITPKMAVALAARILQDQLQLFITFEDAEEEVIEAKDDLEFYPILLKKVTYLDLSVRAQNCLTNINIVYIGDLVAKTESYMLRLQNFGKKSLNEIKETLSKYDLKLGMEIPNWPPSNIEKLAMKYDDTYI